MTTMSLRYLLSIGFIYALLLIKYVSGGRIYGTDIQVTYPIATQATSHSFMILLETILKSGDYLRIKWPYQLDYLVGASEVSIKVVNTTLAISTTTTSLTITDSIYHFTFGMDLLPYYWYAVTLTGVINEQNPQTEGFQTQVEIATVTSTLSNAMEIDSNPIFGTFVLSATPPDTITITPTYSSGYTSVKNVPGQAYQIQLIITTTQSVSSYDVDNPSGVIYEISMTDASFSFQSAASCSFLNRNSGDCVCMLSSTKLWMLTVTCASDLIVTSVSPIKFTVMVVNSMQTVSGTQGFSVSLIYPPTSLIKETGTISTFFVVNSITLSNMSIKLLHGIPYTSGFATSFEAPLGIYIPQSLTPTFQPFNNVRVQFQIDSSTSSTTELQVIGLFNSAEAILESSIVHNFPQFDSTVLVKCYFDLSAYSVTCKGVGQLLPSTTYFLAARIALTSSATITTDSSGNMSIASFGGIQVKSVLSDSSGTSFLGTVTAATYAVSSIPVYYQTEYIDSPGTHSLKNFGANIVASASASGTFATALSSNLANGAKVGIFPSTTASRLIFYVNVQQTQQTYQNFLGFKQTSYMKMIYNDNIVLIDSTYLASGVEIAGTANTAGYYSTYGTSTTDNCIFQQQDLSNNNLFKYVYVKISTQRALLGGNNLGFGLQNVKFPSTFTSSQFVADDRVLDFLLFFQYKDSSSTSTNQLVTNTAMLIHGYTVYSSYINSAYEASYSNIYLNSNSNLKHVNNGYKIPTLLRLFGTLSAAEIGTTASNLKLAVIPDRSVAQFFAVNQYDFDSSTTTLQGCGGTTTTCYAYEDGKSKKITSPPDNWSLSPFILLDLASVTSQLSEAVALLLKSSQYPKTINLAIVAYTSTGSLEVYNVVRVYGASLALTNFATDNRYLTDIMSLTVNANPWNQIADYTESSSNMIGAYKISSLSSIAPSQTASSFLFLSTHTDTSAYISYNVLSTFKLGAGFTISSYKSDLFGFATLSAFPGVTSTTKCIPKFEYQVSTLSNPYYNSVVFCPYDNSAYTDGAAGLGVTFTSLTFPNTWGALYPLKNTYSYAWSSNSGKLITLMSESQSTPSTSKAVGCTATTWNTGYNIGVARQESSITITPSVLATLTSTEDLYQVQMTFDSFPTGLSFVSQCSVVSVATPSHYVTTDYTTCEARLTGTNKIIFVITKVSDDDGITVTFGIGEQFYLYFYVTHTGTVTTSQTQKVVLKYNSYLQDDCNSSAGVTVAAGTTATSTSTTGMIITDLVIDNITSGGNTRVMWDFNYVNRVSIPGTTLRFKLGFLSTPKMVSNLDCQVLEYQTYQEYEYEGINSGSDQAYMPSSKFSTIVYNSLLNSIDVVMRGSYTPPTDPYRMECYGFKAPNGENTDPISVSWIDTDNSNTVIQSSSTNIAYQYNYYKTANTLTSAQLKLVSKKFNTPGYGAVYTIQIIPQKVRMTVNSRIYVEFSSAFLSTLVRKGNTPQCTINSLEVTCLQYPDQARRLIIYPIPLGSTTLEPLVTYTLVISGILQPTTLDSYGMIWVGIDADRTFSNGIQEQGDISDSAISTSIASYLQSPSLSYSTYKIRQPRVMLTLNFTCAARTIQSNRIAIFEVDQAFFNSVFNLFDVYVGREKLTSKTVKIFTGDDGVKIAIAAASSTPLGTYTLALAKVGVFTPFEDPDISPLPSLVVNVQDFFCPLTLSTTASNVPQGVRTGPFILDFDGCLPSEGALVTAAFNPAPTSSTAIYIDSLEKQIVGYDSQKQAIYYIQVDASTVVGTVYTLEITISGVSDKQYTLVANTITLTVVAGPSSTPAVTVSGQSTSLSTDQTTQVFSTTCSQDGFLYWGIGVSEQYLNSEYFTLSVPLSTIQKATTYMLPSTDAYLDEILINKRYKAFQWQGDELDNEEKYLARQYGFAAVTAGSAVTINFNNLPQRSIFSMIYYCESAYGTASQAQNVTWTTSWTLDSLSAQTKSFKHLKIDLTFTIKLSTDQLNNLLCQLQQVFAVNVYSFSQSTCVMCNQTASYTYTEATYQDMSTSNTVCPIISTGTYVYTFYAWSGEQSDGRTVDLDAEIRAQYASIPCIFVQIVNYSLDLNMINGFTNIVVLTSITPTTVANLQPTLNVVSFTQTDTNSTIAIKSVNSDGFLIVGIHHFTSTSSDTSTLTTVSEEPTYLSLRQGSFGDGTAFNLKHVVTPITSGSTLSVTADMTDSQEYILYWTIASMESCGDSMYTPIGFNQFYFKTSKSSATLMRFAFELIALLISLVVLPAL